MDWAQNAVRLAENIRLAWWSNRRLHSLLLEFCLGQMW